MEMAGQFCVEINIQLNVPIFAGGSVSAQSRQAVAQLVKAQADMDARVAELEVELHRQYSAQKNGLLRIAALESAVATSYALIEATQRSFTGGERTNVDVLNAQERLAQSVRDLTQARYEQLLAGLRLRHLAGVLGEADLREVASHFGQGRK
jgi:protease secretion system outer membrane protein